MADRTDTVLADIDGALAAHGTVDRDRTVSPDAMRWTPDKPEKPLPPADCQVTIRLDVSALVAGIEAILQCLGSIVTGLAREAAPLLAAFGAAIAESQATGQLHCHAAGASRRERRRCHACHLFAFQPSCPDGEYYRRRQLARRRRNRRR